MGLQELKDALMLQKRAKSNVIIGSHPERSRRSAVGKKTFKAYLSQILKQVQYECQPNPSFLSSSFQFQSFLRKQGSTLIILALLFTFSSCKKNKETVPYYHTPDFSPIWADEVEVDIDTLHTIAPFSFTNQNGETITNQSFEGKVYAANFFFTTCGSICPKMTNNLQVVADSFPNNENVKLVSYTVTPQIDDVKKLKEYEQLKSINGKQWHLLTGDGSKIYKLARQSYFAEEEPGYNKDSSEFLHTEHCILVDKKGHIRGVYNATLKLEMKRLVEDIAILLKEED